MTFSYSLFVVFGFLAMVLLMEGLYTYWRDTRSPEVKRVQRRLQVWSANAAADERAPLFKDRLLSSTPELHRLLTLVPGVQRLDGLLLQSGSSKKLSSFLLVCCSLAVAGVWAGWLLGNSVVLALLLGLGSAVLTIARLFWLRERRSHSIHAQLPAALDLISRALRAGHAFSAALAMVGNQAQEPIASEFKLTFGEINFGISTQNALLNLAQRVPITDMRYFVMAVIIQLETGGNLAELLTMLGNLIRERFQLLGKIQVIAAEGKLSAYILISLPFLVAGALQVVNPGYMDILLTDTTGIKLVIAALVMMALGALAIWRIVKIRI
jgi:tight adherence protein B